MYTAELFNGSLSSQQLARKEAARQENKKNKLKCSGCPTYLRTGTRARGTCDNCERKKVDTSLVTRREDMDYLYNLRPIQQASGLTMADIAERANLELASLRSWAYEGDSRQRAPLHAQKRVAFVLGVNLEELRG